MLRETWPLHYVFISLTLGQVSIIEVRSHRPHVWLNSKIEHFQESWLSWGNTGRKWEGTATICNCQWFPKYTELGTEDETRQNQLSLCWSHGLPIRYSSFRVHAFSCMTFILNNEMEADLIRLQYTSRTVVVRVTKTHTGNELLWYSFNSYYIF